MEKFPNISETFILDEIVGMIRRGIDIDVYALRRGGDADIHPAYLTYRLSERTFYCVPAIRGRIARLLAAVPATVRMLLRNPLGAMKCAVTRKSGMQTRTFISLARAFVNRGQTYDVIHAHFGPNGIRAQVLRQAKIITTPLITTFHGYDATSFVVDNGTAVYADLAAQGDQFIAVSQSMARNLEVIGIPTSRTIVMPLGVDCSDAPSRLRHADDRVVRVVSIGRFVEKKGFEFAIKAITKAFARYPFIAYDVIGDGELRPRLELLVAQLNAREFITFHGYKDQAAINEMLSRSDILLAPSVTAANGDQESMPIVIKEAMERMLPVVASRHAGIPEIVADGISGLLADERDVDTLAEHLVSLATDVGRRHSLGDAGRRIIAADFDNERLLDDLLLLYRAVAMSLAHS